jgi:hypothetical protein
MGIWQQIFEVGLRGLLHEVGFLRFTNTNETIEWRPMMWMSYAMVENKHVGKWLTTYYSALRWAKANNGQPTRLLWQVPIANGMTLTLRS